jgi:tubulin polyglutamylase TTLL9
MHLTNVAIQKNSDNYDETLGGKWFLDKLKHYLISKYGGDKINISFYKIQ